MVAPVRPGRTGNGLAMRLGVFLEALATVADVDLLTFHPSIHPADPLPRALGVRRIRLANAGRADSQFQLLSRIADDAARLQAFKAYGRPSAATGITLPVLGEIEGLAKRRGYRLVHVGRSYMIEAGLAAAGSGAALTLDLDEDDRRSCETQAEEIAGAEGPSPAAEWLRLEGAACDRLVAKFGGRFAHIFVAGSNDRETLAKRHPNLDLTVLPNAVAIPNAPTRKGDGKRLLFVGTMGYAPNREGMTWFVEEVLPRLRALAGPDIHLEIAGLGTPSTLLRAAKGGAVKGVKALGFVSDLGKLYAGAGLVVAPLFSGSGTRIKLLEAAAHAVPMVVSPIAAQGLPFADGESAWVADEPDGFARACAEALADPAEAARRAAAARALVIAHHNREAAVGRLASVFEVLLG